MKWEGSVPLSAYCVAGPVLGTLRKEKVLSSSRDHEMYCCRNVMCDDKIYGDYRGEQRKEP